MKDKEITVTADELQKQKLYTADVAAIMQVRAMHGTPKALVRTYGCQQNVADGERMKGMLSEMGFEFTEDEDEADFILFNTCAIREHAEDRVFGNIGALICFAILVLTLLKWSIWNKKVYTTYDEAA